MSFWPVWHHHNLQNRSWSLKLIKWAKIIIKQCLKDLTLVAPNKTLATSTLSQPTGWTTTYHAKITGNKKLQQQPTALRTWSTICSSAISFTSGVWLRFSDPTVRRDSTESRSSRRSARDLMEQGSLRNTSFGVLTSTSWKTKIIATVISLSPTHTHTHTHTQNHSIFIHRDRQIKHSF